MTKPRTPYTIKKQLDPSVMASGILNTFRFANVDRFKHCPHPKIKNTSKWGDEDFIVALYEELGELAGILKRVSRKDYKLVDVKLEICKELADIYTYFDLFAATKNAKPGILMQRDSSASVPSICNRIGLQIGLLQHYLAQLKTKSKIGQDRFWVGQHRADDIEGQLAMTAGFLDNVAYILGLDFYKVLACKFNEVSARVDCPLRFTSDYNVVNLSSFDAGECVSFVGPKDFCLLYYYKKPHDKGGRTSVKGDDDEQLSSEI